MKKGANIKMVKFANPLMLKIKDNNGNTAIVKIKEFHYSMMKYCHEFGYPTVTEEEIRENVYKICMLGEEENLDVIGHLVKSHIHEDEHGKYRLHFS